MCGMCLFWLALAGFECLLENLIFKSGKCPKGMSFLYLQLLAHGLFYSFLFVLVKNSRYLAQSFIGTGTPPRGFLGLRKTVLKENRAIGGLHQY